MLTSIEGIYENGRVRLLEPLPGVMRARVVVTLLPEPTAPRPPPAEDTTEHAAGVAPDRTEEMRVRQGIAAEPSAFPETDFERI